MFRCRNRATISSGWRSPRRRMSSAACRDNSHASFSRLQLGHVAVDVPAFPPRPAIHLQLAAMSVERLDDVVEFHRLGTVAAALNTLHTVKQLSLVRLARAARADQQQLVPDTVVMPRRW